MIAQQLEPYIRSITAMMERVQPEVAIKKNWTNIKKKGDVFQEIQPRAVLQVAAGVGEEEEVVEPSRGQGQEEGLRGHEDERIAAILERIQAIKPEYKQRCVFNSHHQHSSPSQVLDVNWCS